MQCQTAPGRNFGGQSKSGHVACHNEVAHTKSRHNNINHTNARLDAIHVKRTPLLHPPTRKVHVKQWALLLAM